MKYRLLSLLVTAVFLMGSARAQMQSKYWHFGDSAGVVFTYGTNPPPALPLNNSRIHYLDATGNISNGAFEGVTSMSDANGTMLFYSEGSRIWGKNNQVMPYFSGSNRLSGDPSSTQSGISIPKPGSPGKYYLFTTPATGTGKMRYTVIDMALNGGNGDVVNGSINVVVPGQTRNVSEKLTAITHPNGVDYWVITHEYNTGSVATGFLVYLVTANGITLSSTFSEPATNFLTNDYYGYLKSNPAGNMLASALPASNKVALYNFDKVTGTITAYRVLVDGSTTNFLKQAYGVEFSPDGRLLYATALPWVSNNNIYTHTLTQFNLLAGTQTVTDIMNSAVIVYSYHPNLATSTNYTGLGAVQLGPDKRIYFTKGASNTLSYINLPNVIDTGCQVRPDQITLSKGIAYNGLPNIVSQLVLPVDTTKFNECAYINASQTDSNCCTAGFTFGSAMGPRITSVTYDITGGVMQGYTASCAGSPSSASLSGTSTGVVNIPGTCMLSYFNTALQSTTASGNMTVTYTVVFANGNYCKRTVNVKGCKRMPMSKCDSVKVNQCVCPGAASSYLNIFITNQVVPASPVCKVIVAKLDTNGQPMNNFFNATSSAVLQPDNSWLYPNINPPSGANVSNNTLGNPGQTLNIQANYPTGASVAPVRITIVHCDGDTCTYTWNPPACVICPKMANYTMKQTSSPYPKIIGQTFIVKGPTENITEPNPYGVRYVTISITDTTGAPEIVGTTGAEMYYTKGREFMQPLSFVAHARYDALLEFRAPLSLQPNDSSGKFQMFFARSIPRKLTISYYNGEGAMMTTQDLQMDTTIRVGILELGKTGGKPAGPQLFNGYPNPTQNAYTLMLATPVTAKYTYRVIDLEGKEVLTVASTLLQAGIHETTLHLETLPAGVYNIIAETEGQETTRTNALRVVVIR